MAEEESAEVKKFQENLNSILLELQEVKKLINDKKSFLDSILPHIAKKPNGEIGEEYKISYESAFSATDEAIKNLSFCKSIFDKLSFDNKKSSKLKTTERDFTILHEQIKTFKNLLTKEQNSVLYLSNCTKYTKEYSDNIFNKIQLLYSEIFQEINDLRKIKEEAVTYINDQKHSFGNLRKDAEEKMQVYARLKDDKVVKNINDLYLRANFEHRWALLTSYSILALMFFLGLAMVNHGKTFQPIIIFSIFLLSALITYAINSDQEKKNVNQEKQENDKEEAKTTTMHYKWYEKLVSYIKDSISNKNSILIALATIILFIEIYYCWNNPFMKLFNTDNATTKEDLWLILLQRLTLFIPLAFAYWMSARKVSNASIMTAEYAHRKSLIEQRITSRTEYIEDSSKIIDEKLKDALINNYYQAQLESLQAFLESPSKVLMKNKNEMKIKDITEIIKEIGEMQKILQNNNIKN